MKKIIFFGIANYEVNAHKKRFSKFQETLAHCVIEKKLETLIQK